MYVTQFCKYVISVRHWDLNMEHWMEITTINNIKETIKFNTYGEHEIIQIILFYSYHGWNHHQGWKNRSIKPKRLVSALLLYLNERSAKYLKHRRI